MSPKKKVIYNERRITFVLPQSEHEILEKAVKISSLTMSSFCRSSALMHARKILNEIKPENEKTTD